MSDRIETNIPFAGSTARCTMKSIFAARRNYPTEKVFDWLRDTWY